MAATESYPTSINHLRKGEYATLAGTTYLDHAGTTPYPKSLIKDMASDLTSNLFGNPHSSSPASQLSTQRVEATRRRLIAFFRADPAEYELIFVQNATAGIKLVLECMLDYCKANDVQNLWYGYHADAHTSLVGGRMLATQSRCFSSDADVETWFSDTTVPSAANTIGLFAFPGQSNMNGRRLPLSWPSQLRRSHHSGTYTLLDAAALASTTQLDLNSTAPDFTALSLYKIFGYPDIGALIVRKSASHLLQARRYFGGGTVDMVINPTATTAGEAWVASKTSLHERLEDGTSPFHNIIALNHAMTVHVRLYGSMSCVSAHTSTLCRQLYQRMSTLHHHNGAPLCIIYTPNNYTNPSHQGPNIAFNLLTSSHTPIGKSLVEALAVTSGIQLRTGGVCNPGGIAKALDLTPTEMRESFALGVRCGNAIDTAHNKPTGIVRVSLGAMTMWDDIAHFLSFLELFIDNGASKPAALVKDDSKEKSTPSMTSEEEYVEDLTCPVPHCQVTALSREALFAHFAVHAVPRKRGRNWSWRKWMKTLVCA